MTTCQPLMFQELQNIWNPASLFCYPPSQKYDLQEQYTDNSELRHPCDPHENRLACLQCKAYKINKKEKRYG